MDTGRKSGFVFEETSRVGPHGQTPQEHEFSSQGGARTFTKRRPLPQPYAKKKGADLGSQHHLCMEIGLILPLPIGTFCVDRCGRRSSHWYETSKEYPCYQVYRSREIAVRSGSRLVSE